MKDDFEQEDTTGVKKFNLPLLEGSREKFNV